MSGYTIRATFAGYASTILGGNITPAFTTGWQPGDLALLHTGVFSLTISAPTITGWTKLTGNATAKCNALYARILETGDTAAAFQWDASHAVFGGIFTFFGDVNPTLGSIVDGSSEKSNNHTVSAAPIFTEVNALTPANSNDLVIRCGWTAKTAASNGNSFADWATDTGIYTKGGNIIQNGSNIAGGFWYNQQGAATATHADTAALSSNETATLSYQSVVMALTSVAPPGAGAITVAGVTPSVVGATASVLTPLTARQGFSWRDRLRTFTRDVRSGLIVPETRVLRPA